MAQKTKIYPFFDPLRDHGTINVIKIDAGNSVICDTCGSDYTNSNESGGFLFGSNAVCPECAPKVLKGAQEDFCVDRIKSRCPQDKSFADFIRELR